MNTATRYPAPEIKDVPDDIRARILEVQEKAGFVPNVFLALARRPAEWRAFFAYHDTLMLKEEGSLTKGDREMIVTATSAANKCLYCVVAHGALLRIYEKKPLVADQVAVNYRKAEITPRLLRHRLRDRRERRELARAFVHDRIEPFAVDDLLEIPAGRRFRRLQHLRADDHALHARPPECGDQAREVGDGQAIAQRARDR